MLVAALLICPTNLGPRLQLQLQVSTLALALATPSPVMLARTNPGRGKDDPSF